MGEHSIGRLLVRYSLPTIAGFMAAALYQFVDRVLVGRGVGTDGVAVVTSAFPLAMVAMALGLLVGTGTGNRISVLLGQKDAENAERMLGQGLRLSLFNGIGLAILVWAFTGPLLLACGCAPHLLPMAIPFARIMSLGQIFLIAMVSMGNIMRVQGHPNLSLLLALASNLLNVALASVAIFGLHWGTTGTALATAISQAAGCLAVIAFVQSRHSALHIRGAFLKSNRPLARSILTLGAPFGVMHLLGMVTFLAANHGAGGQAGTRGVAVLGILSTVSMMMFYPPLGMMQAMMPLVGFNKGAGHIHRVRSLVKRVLLITTAMGALFSILVALFPGAVAGMFSKTDPELVEMVRQGLPWFVVPITFFGLTGTTAHYYLAIHEPKKAAALLLGRELVAMPLFLLLPHWLGYFGLYLVGPLAALPFATMAGVFMVSELRKLRVASTANQQPAEKAAS
jgi:putative MATE family efflux protein